MAPILRTQLYQAIDNGDQTTFVVLLKAMAAACNYSESDVIQAVWEVKYRHQWDYLTNPLLSLLIKTDRVSEFSQIWSRIYDRQALFRFCLLQPDFMTKVLAEYEVHLNITALKASPMSGSFTFLDTDLYIWHRLLCTSYFGQVDPIVERVVDDILTNRVNSYAEFTDFHGNRPLYNLAIVMEANIWLQSLYFQCSNNPIELGFNDDYFNYMFEHGLIKDQTLTILAKIAPVGFINQWFGPVFNSTPVNRPDRLTWAENILMEVLPAFPQRGTEDCEIDLKITALFKYSQDFIQIILALVRCGQAGLSGSVETLTVQQINQVLDLLDYSYDKKILIATESTGAVFKQLEITPEYSANLTKAEFIFNLLGRGCEPNRQFYDCVLARMPDDSNRVKLFRLCFLEGYGEIAECKGKFKFSQADIDLVKQAMVKTSDYAEWVNILSPDNWLDGLDQLYQTSPNRELFIAYGLECADSTAAEISKALETSKISKDESIPPVLWRVTDLGQLKRATGLIQYFNRWLLAINSQYKYEAAYFLLPEITSFI